MVVSGGDSYEELDRAARLIRDAVLGVKDVSDAELIGARDRRILIDADRERLESLGISITELLRAVQQKNVSIPAGALETSSREYLLRTVGSLRGVGEFERVIVRRTAGSGAVVRLGELATVMEAFDERGSTVSLNGERAITIRVSKVARGDSIGVIDRVKAIVERLEPSLPAGVRVDLLNDSTVQIRDSIDVLVANAIQGLIILVAILFVFLGARNALMTALGIPVTFAITFLALESLGETLNSNTLFGLVLVLGLIVDHAIVITENSYRLRRLGYGLKDAAIQGTSQVAWPIEASTLTTVAAFLPLMILPGTIGKFLRVIPLVVSIALIASTLEAIIFIPAHMVEWPGGKTIKTKPDLFDRIRLRFEGFVRALYRKRLFVVLGFFLVAGGIFATVPFIRQDLFSAEDFTLFYIDIDMPGGTNRARTEELVRRYEERLLPLVGNGEVVNVQSSVGFRSGGSGNTSAGNVAQIVVDLAEVKEGRKRTITDIMDEARWTLADIPGPENVIYRKAQSGPPVSSPIGFRLRGDDYGALISVATQLRERLGGYPELVNVTDTLQTGTPELRVAINEDRAAAYGLSVSSIGSFIRGSYDGFPAGTVFINNNELDVIVRYAGGGSASLARLLELKLPTPDGRLVPFSAVASLEEGAALAAIRRVDGKRELGVSSDALDKAVVSGVNADVKAWFEREIRPRNPGMELVVGGEFAELQDLLVQIARVFLLGIFLIYAVLGAQFKSFTQPLLILLSVPMAFAGVVLFLVISGTPFSTTVLYAGVALAGIAVNDSIVLIDFINGARKEGKSIADAVAEGVSTRLRPVILTSVTTIGGLLPIAVGLGDIRWYGARWPAPSSSASYSPPSPR